MPTVVVGDQIPHRFRTGGELWSFYTYIV
jgi:hypothetical protein